MLSHPSELQCYTEMPGANSTKTLGIIFSALFIDILAFTIILPLFPRILDDYHERHKDDTMMAFVQKFKAVVGLDGDRFDSVLFGGFLGSLFSLMQVGNALSMFFWMFSTSFTTFAVSRIIGGLTEGNVQISMAMISDITTTKTRSKGMALVGIAFALGFTVGPPIGALFASIDVLEYFPFLRRTPVHSYSGPALFALFLIVVETIYMLRYLPETLVKKKEKADDDLQKKKTPAKTIKTDASKYKRLAFIMFLFLFIFSGIEFTLTFLTYERFQYTNAQQGKLLGYVGIMSALIQGGYVRRVINVKYTEKKILIQGLIACTLAILTNGLLAVEGTRYIWVGVTFMAFTTGTVVTCLNGLASMYGEEKGNYGEKMGSFRSIGQMGRALGPVFGCTLFWLLGSKLAYFLAAIAMGSIVLAARKL